MQPDSPLELILHSVGVVLALSAAIIAIYLIPLAKRVLAWTSMSAAFVLFAIERTLELLVHKGMVMDETTWETANDVLHLSILIFLLFGIILIRNLFVERENANRKMLDSIDELQRFYDATIGRELRMKELYEENQRLKQRQEVLSVDADEDCHG
ncbi:MAG: hypothetical protein WA632_04905 [Gallionella sp.]